MRSAPDLVRLAGGVMLVVASATCPSAGAEQRAGDGSADAVGQAAGGVVDRAVKEAAEEAVSEAAEEAVKEAAEQAVSEAAEEAVGRAVKQAAEQAASEAVEKTIEKAARDEAAKEELKARRPDDWRGPTRVHFLVFVLDIDAIDDANQSFMANVYLRLRWHDRRLADPGAPRRQVRLEDIWNPQVILANRQGLVSRSLPEVVQVDPDGTVTYRQRYSGMLSQPLQLADFPMDRHTFSVQFVSAAYGAEELEFVPDTSPYDPALVGGAIADALSVPDWEILKHEAVVEPYRPVPELQIAGMVFRLEARRYVGYYLWQVVLPLSVVVVMSWAAFWFQRGQPGVRIGVATSSVLTLIAHRFVLASLLPRLPYMTRMDYFAVGCTMLVFVALIGVVLTSYLHAAKHDVGAARVDFMARALFPASFALLLGWFLSGLP
jgi:hypothetical protein